VRSRSKVTKRFFEVRSLFFAVLVLHRNSKRSDLAVEKFIGYKYIFNEVIVNS